MSIAEKLQTIAENEQKVFNAGKKAEHDAFWKSVQTLKDGKTPRTKYDYAFSYQTWTDKNFFPVYDIVPITAERIFVHFGNGTMVNDDGSSYDLNLVERLAECGVKLDFSKCTSLSAAFQSARISHIGVVDCSSLSKADNIFLNSRFQYIEKVISKESLTWGNAFQQAYFIEEIRFEGLIGKNIDISPSTNLSHDSLISIINALKDYSNNLLPYPYASTTHTDANGITWTDNGDGSITVNGTAKTFDVPFWFLKGELVLPIGSYAFYLGANSTDLYTNIESTDKGAAGLIASGNNTNIIRFTLDKETTLDSIFVYPYGTATIDNVVLKPKLISTTASGAGYTCTLGPINLAKLTDAEKAIATEKGWTLA